MKYILLLIAICHFSSSFAQTSKTTVADGDWFDPQIWSPAGVPAFVSDTIAIDHEVTVAQNIDMDIAHLLIGSKGVLDCDSSLLLNGSIRVDGELYVGEAFGIGVGDYTLNFGVIEVEDFLNTNTLGENHGIIEADFMPISEPFLNGINGVIEVGEFVTGDFNLENNGAIFADDWMHVSSANGTGTICVEDCFQNTGAIGGSLDVCDLSPNGGVTCDFNFGTIASSVTMCTNGQCTPTSIETNESTARFSLFPNPLQAGQSLTLTQSNPQATTVRIIDQLGKVVVTERIARSTVVLQEQLRSGIYFVQLIDENEEVSQQKLVVY